MIAPLGPDRTGGPRAPLRAARPGKRFGIPVTAIAMSIRIVQLGRPRQPGEGLRIGTVRRPPRGVPKADFARQDWYDVWFPELAPSAETVSTGLSATTDKAWASFVRKYRREMKAPASAHALDLLAALSHQANVSVGCYCDTESRCHRSVLRELLLERGARIA